MGHRTRRSAPESETVTGVLIPHGWDEHFSVTSISLACDGEREIVINNLDAHPGLLVLLRKRISATGTVIRGEQGESMAVQSYRPLKENDGNEFGSKGTTHENSL